MLNLSDEGAQSQRLYCSILPARGAQLERYIHKKGCIIAFFAMQPFLLFFYSANEVISVPADIAEICNIDGSILAKPGIILVCGNNQIKLANSESYGAIRYGLNVGDIIKCAVLESGRYCFITVY